MNWRLLDTFLLRRPGFSFDLLDGFASPEVAADAADWARADDEAEQVRAVLLRDLFGAAVSRARERGDGARLRTLSKLRRGVGARRPRPVPDALDGELAEAYQLWLERLAQADRLAEKVGAQLESAWRRGARDLRSLAATPDFADALLQLSPDFHQAASRYGPTASRTDGAAARAHDRRLYAYLQRLAAKNETTSAFGPVTFGRFGPVDEPSVGPERPGGVRLRRTFVSFWAAAAIGRTATRGAEVRRLVPPRRLPIVRVAGDHAVLAGRPPIPVSAAQSRVLAACDGVRTVDDIADATGLDGHTVAAAVVRLERAALVQRRCEPCSTAFDPLGDVLRQLPDAATLTRFTAGARRFGELVAEFSAAEPERRPAALSAAEHAFTELTGMPARRNAGGTYADRLVLFEDCHGDTEPLVLPDRWRRRIERDLAVIFDVGLAVGQLVRQAHRGLAVEVLGDQPEQPFMDFADRLAEQVAAGGLTARLARAHAVGERYRQLVAAANDGRTATLDVDRFRALARPTPGAAFVSPDLLLTGTGDGQIVLGEIHPYVFGWGLQGGFAPDEHALRAELEQLLPVWGGERSLATVLHRRRHKGLVSNRFPGTFVEIASSAHTAARRTTVAQLRVVLIDGEPVLLGPDGPLELYIGEEDHPHLRVFAPAQVELPRLALGERSPRVVVGDVVVQRQRWELTANDRAELAVADPRRLPLAVAALRRRLGLPRHVFAASPQETKPLYVDLDSIFSHHGLQRLAELGPVRLVEMLPTPDQLWLRRAAGRFTSELRLSMVRSGGANP